MRFDAVLCARYHVLEWSGLLVPKEKKTGVFGYISVCFANTSAAH